MQTQFYISNIHIGSEQIKAYQINLIAESAMMAVAMENGLLYFPRLELLECGVTTYAISQRIQGPNISTYIFVLLKTPPIKVV